MISASRRPGRRGVVLWRRLAGLTVCRRWARVDRALHLRKALPSLALATFAGGVIMVPLVVVNVRNGFWWMTVLGSVALAAACLMVVWAHCSFSQLRDGAGGLRPFSPFAPMVGVAVVTGLAAIIGVVTALALIPG